MQTFLDCFPCFLRQALDATRFVTDDESIQEQVLRETLEMMHEMDMSTPPPEIGYHIHRRIRALTGNPDPYLEQKQISNRFVLDQLPVLRKRVENADDPLEMAARLAVAGNVIDFGVSSEMDLDYYREVIERAMNTPFDPQEIQHFKQAMANARDILYLADNAGEIVFDRLLIEQMPTDRVTLVVKAAPILNDALFADAEAAGLTDRVTVIDNGSDAPGTLLHLCSESFRERFKQADMIVSKGQANYESLSRCAGPVFFLLKIKCPVIGRDAGHELGEFVLEAHPMHPGKSSPGDPA
jgi:hypothetical protein